MVEGRPDRAWMRRMLQPNGPLLDVHRSEDSWACMGVSRGLEKLQPLAMRASR